MRIIVNNKKEFIEKDYQIHYIFFIYQSIFLSYDLLSIESLFILYINIEGVSIYIYLSLWIDVLIYPDTAPYDFRIFNYFLFVSSI